MPFLDYEFTENQEYLKVEFFYHTPVLTEKEKHYRGKKHLVYSLTFTRPDKMGEKIYDEYLCKSVFKKTNKTLHSMIRSEIVKILDFDKLIKANATVSFSTQIIYNKGVY